MMIQSNSKLKIVRTIALLCISIGLFYLIENYRGHFWFITMLFDDRYLPKNIHQSISIGQLLLPYSFSLILMLRPIAGFGLVRLKTWGRNLTIGVLVADFILRAISFYNFHTFALRHPELVAEMKEMLANGATVAARISIIPSYIIAFISLVSVIYLLKIDVKELQK